MGRMWMVLLWEAQGPVRCPEWKCLLLKKDVLWLKEAGMIAKEGLVCQGWVSLEIWCLRSELSMAACESRTVQLSRIWRL